jgi:hypothetical protein
MITYKNFINEGNIPNNNDEFNEGGNDIGQRLEQDLFELERSEDAVKVIEYDNEIPINNYEDIRNPQEGENERVSLKEQHKHLKIVLGVYFGGDTVLQKLEDDAYLGLGSSDGDSWYGLDMAYAVLSPYDIIYNNRDEIKEDNIEWS